MRFKKLVGNAMLYAPTEGNAGYDLTAAEDYYIAVGQAVAINTGVAVELPKGCAGIVLGRSGNAFRSHVYVRHIGLIDENYRGEIKVLLEASQQPVMIHAGDKIAQMIVVPVLTEPLEEVNELSLTERGVHGFGSTGYVQMSFISNNDDYRKEAA